MEGLILVRTQLLGTLQDEGLERIPVLGLPFDPHVSESVGTEPVTDPDHHQVVVREPMRGYRIAGKVARASRVVIGEYQAEEAKRPFARAAARTAARGRRRRLARGADARGDHRARRSGGAARHRARRPCRRGSAGGGRAPLARSRGRQEVAIPGHPDGRSRPVAAARGTRALDLFASSAARATGVRSAAARLRHSSYADIPASAVPLRSPAVGFRQSSCTARGAPLTPVAASPPSVCASLDRARGFELSYLARGLEGSSVRAFADPARSIAQTSRSHEARGPVAGSREPRGRPANGARRTFGGRAKAEDFREPQ